ncbi:hypothetical protein [Parasphingorhabdus cellanae]|uniref:DUF3617 family protein n=1 Tax=Parasphingorhabdus cellanae TaxID=2806553 RepID=A0ABX7T4L3_9SPHN|nr:hypothetical protein [Parasphingorhabdus cellanae]QTD56528.1 hypothetical protein J4G78_02720 [Parasphingorhabdus cellanae]
MKGITLIKVISASTVAFLAFSVSVPAQAPELELLNGLQKGEWTLKTRSSASDGQKVCLGDPGILLQIKHGGAACSRYIIQDTPNSVRVSYKCGSSDHGVTTIKRESSGLVQIQSQGIQNNAPFSFNVEGRRTGSC